eukprot:CAMPEP_0184519284 /NCGR_PEP_ID=MMETSP0198_2-20121128/6547_1 /TAXON_ID=1112570 /ORGANISM="Thraustochytrium sp., Strain LLF1b" /LENGTH=286 /DNA_ID=CAMNT_0026909795 /DNA_START=144 /DNA_END=1004 /DNA_ORIENTATION=-
MGERKVLNKYISPDFDPNRLGRVKGKSRDAAQSIRLMLPFSLCCETCRHYMRAGKKFNATKEVAKGLEYLTIKRFRFRMKCEVCKAPIAFLTDPKLADYEMESGATRNYDFHSELKKANRAELEAAKASAAAEGQEDSMAKLENRTLESQKEREVLDELENLRNQSRKRARLDLNEVLPRSSSSQPVDVATQAMNDEKEVRAAFAAKRSNVKRLEEGGDVNSSVALPVSPQARTVEPLHSNSSEMEKPMVQLKVTKRAAAVKPSQPSTGLLLGYGSSSSDEDDDED